MNTIMQLLGIMITASLVNNVVLSQFLGLCPFLGVSKKTDTALGMGLAATFVITLASAVCGLIYKFIQRNSIHYHGKRFNLPREKNAGYQNFRKI
jgi:electron transport complex protein RnfA